MLATGLPLEVLSVMATEILINVRPSETRVAFVENGVLTDLTIEKKSSPTFVGSIFRGTVTRVLPGMQAAFVDIGLEKAGFLYVGDVLDESNLDSGFLDPDSEAELETEAEVPATSDGSSPSAGSLNPGPKIPIQELLKEGQDILVQVSKDPLGTKGARLTTHLSLAGRFLVYLPNARQLGISRKIESEAERNRLKNLVKSIQPPGGVIVRTAGEGASEESLRSDIESMDRVAKEVFRNYEKRKTPGLVYQEIDVELRALRDMLTDSVQAVWVDDVEAQKKIHRFVGQILPKFRQQIFLHEGPEPLFDRYDLDLEISRCLDRKIWLKSGGSLVFDEAEALVVIDVNTGRFVGKKDLDETILKNNLEAAREIAHQIRVRNCGGIIIVDFIDMQKTAHREKVLAVLNEEVRSDRARTQVISMTGLGLVEITRKRNRPSLLKELCEPCSYCEGRGWVKKVTTVAHEILRELERGSFQEKKEMPLLVRCHAQVLDWMYENEESQLVALEKRLARSIAFKSEPSFHIERFVMEIQKKALPQKGGL